MTPYRYFFSTRITDPSPPVNELLVMEAESPTAAVTQLAERGLLPADWESQWIHFLVWSSEDGSNCGFQSLRLSEVLNSAR